MQTIYLTIFLLSCSFVFTALLYFCLQFLYRCGCEAGFKLSANNRTCDDVDECELHKSYRLCVGICENIPGSYRCTCPDGYRIGTDARSCEGIFSV